MKLWQRAWCLERGFDAMTWSYDPLVARNAYFNIQRLGARPVEYNANFYGEMTDAVNAGQGSDRILIHWDLIKQPASGSSGTEGYPAAHQALSNVDGAPSQYTPPPTLTAGPGREEPVTTSRVAVPEDIESLRRHDPGLAKIWRYRSREALIDLMDSGFQITGFDTEGSSSAGSGSGSGHYVLTRSSSAEVSEH